MKGQRGSGGTAPVFHHLGFKLGVSGWLRSHSGRCIPEEVVRYPLYGRLLGPRDRYGQLWVWISIRPSSCGSLYRHRYRVNQTYVCQVNCKNVVWFRSNITANTWTDTAAWIQKNKSWDLCFCWILFAGCSLGYKKLILSNHLKLAHVQIPHLLKSNRAAYS